MKIKIFFLFLILIPLFVFSAITTYAAIEIKANHSLVSIEPIESETLVTLEISLINSGTIDLNEIILVLASPAVITDPSAYSLNIGPISVGEEITKFWEIRLMAFEQVSSMMSSDIYLDLSVIDQNDETSKIEVVSRGDTK